MSGSIHPAHWLVDVLVEKMSDGIEEDRILIILDREDQFGYVDTEGCKVYLVTVEEAQLVPAPRPAHDDYSRKTGCDCHEDESLRAHDPDYSPAYQDEYQRLWHRDAALLLRAEEERDEYAAALREIAFPELRGPNPDAGIVIARRALTPEEAREKT